MPLGHGAATSVFLAGRDGPAAGLLRLKIWRAAAPPDFLDRFRVLQSGLDQLADPAIERPLAAYVDATGRPLVLSHFRQGVPLGDAVRGGVLSSQVGIALIRELRDVLLRAHACGLAHGSIVPGNVLVEPDLRAAFLVDFGLAPLLQPAAPVTTLVVGDLRALAALSVTFPPPSLNTS